MSDRYAILIGNSQFPQEERLQDLACPEQDVEDLHSLLSDPEHGAFTESHVLLNRPHYEVLRTINQVLKKVSKQDLVLIYYSGHGKLDLAGRLYLAANDTEFGALEATSIPVQNIKSYIDITPSTKTALILDCCYSGAVQKAFFRGEVDDQLNLMSGGRGTFIITASTGIQLATEKEEDRNGVFTKHLLEGIRGGTADRDGDGYITMNELYQYVHDQVIAESHQEPMKWDLNVRGELIVAKSGKTPREDRRREIRERFLSLAGEGLIPDDVLSGALEIAAVSATDLDTRRKRLDQLLDDFMADRLVIGNFIGGWYKITAEPSEPEHPPEPPRAEVPQRESGGQTAGRGNKRAGPWSKPRNPPAAPKPPKPGGSRAGFVFSLIAFVAVIAAHGLTAVVFVAMIQNISRYRYNSSSKYSSYYVDEDMGAIYLALLAVAFVVMLLLRRFLKRAARLKAQSSGRPRSSLARAAVWASSLGILGFLIINGVALFVELEWMM